MFLKSKKGFTRYVKSMFKKKELEVKGNHDDKYFHCVEEKDKSYKIIFQDDPFFNDSKEIEHNIEGFINVNKSFFEKM